MFAVEIENATTLSRRAEPVRFGVPLPRGRLFDLDRLEVTGADERVLGHQAAALARWPDGSVKWLHVDTRVDVAAGERTSLALSVAAGARGEPDGALRLAESPEAVRVDTGTGVFKVARSGPQLLGIEREDGTACRAVAGVRLRAVDAAGRTQHGAVDALAVEDAGPLRATLCATGRFTPGGRSMPLRFTLRWTFLAGTSRVLVDVTVTNPRAARHAANLWDLGDPGSCRLRELTLVVAPAEPPAELRWYARPDDDAEREASPPWSIYQDSSGGDNWDSDNHVDAVGEPTVRFRGYRVQAAAGAAAREGERAQPGVAAACGATWIAVAVRDFWQNFPKALRVGRDALTIGLFPGDAMSPHEIQGGERKRHSVRLDAGADAGVLDALRRWQLPVAVRCDPAAVEASGAVPCLTALPDGDLRRYVDGIVDGPDSFFDKREIIDEYGWRNFGELYADHEATRRGGCLVSHYNNQYDFILAALVHFLRTGDPRWHRLMDDLARHVMDIDIYHTQEDRPAYNGGMFWHTDHYQAAATCTHRTFSRHNYTGRSYGGGPGNEHNYTSGLLHYHYLTGDPEARAAVLSLADWVIAMDDGERTVFSLFNSRPTGLASCTVSPDFHKPGRGAGNSINALMDGYALTGDRGYMDKAEQLIRRCIHPADDVAALGLDEPEYRWSYLVFLQVLAKYLDVKIEYGELDYAFHFGRASLLRYADWMLEHEVPYKDVLHKVDLPTETWPAQDIRKSHVMHVAARHCGDDRAAAFRERAGFFFRRCIEDVLGFETASLTRPRVILAAYGHVHEYFARRGEVTGDRAPDVGRAYDFGRPCEFVPQRGLLSRSLVSRAAMVALELRRAARDTVARLRLRLSPPRRRH